MKKLLLLFLFGTMAYAQPNINPPMDLFICQIGGGTGMGVFDLTVNNEVMLFGLDESLYSVKYYDTAAQAEYGTADYITNANSFVSMNGNVIYARVTEIASSTNYTVASFELIVSSVPEVPNFPALIQCQGPFDLTANENLIEGPSSISYHTSSEDADSDINPIANPQNYSTETSASVWVRIAAINGPCYTIQEQELSLYPEMFEVTVEIEDQTITFVTSPEGDYQYSLDGGAWQDSPTFTNLAYGVHTGQIQNQCGTVMAYTIQLTPLAPIGQAEQTINEGDTLADLEVEGENIQWYETETGDTPLNMSTVLVDDTTYYAAQSIDGVESSLRLGVTVHLTASIADNAFTTLRYYPNPASSILNIENANAIDSVSIVNTLGQIVFTKAVNSNSAQVDVSSLGKGIYFVTVASGSAAKTVKIIKE